MCAGCDAAEVLLPILRHGQDDDRTTERLQHGADRSASTRRRTLTEATAHAQPIATITIEAVTGRARARYGPGTIRPASLAASAKGASGGIPGAKTFSPALPPSTGNRPCPQSSTRAPALACAPSQIDPCAKWCVHCTFCQPVPDPRHMRVTASPELTGPGATTVARASSRA